MSRKLIISRYREDVRWISKISDLFNEIIILNKYSGENLLPNINREAHSFIWYLNNLIISQPFKDDQFYFVQGNPEDHITNIRDCIEEVISKEKDSLYAPIIDTVLQCDLEGNPHMNPFLLRNMEKVYRSIFQLNYDQDCPRELEFHPYGMFRINYNLLFNSEIKSRLYHSLVLLSGFNFTTSEILDDTKQENRLPWIMERLYKEIFTKDIE